MQARIRRADRVILPGVGAAGATMENLRALGLDRVLRDDVAQAGKPFLGICIGIQILMERSDEDRAECLGIVAGNVRARSRIDRRAHRSKCRRSDGIACGRPNLIRCSRACPTIRIFISSIHIIPVPADSSATIATSEYGVPFTAAIARDNVIATQFHLEKSGAAGLKLLDNFCRLQF